MTAEAQIEAENAKLKQKNGKLRSALMDTRPVARDCIGKNSNINCGWVIGKVTATIAWMDLI